MVPATLILHPYSVVELPADAGIVFFFIDYVGAKPHYEPVGRGDDVHQALRPTNIQARVIVNFA